MGLAFDSGAPRPIVCKFSVEFRERKVRLESPLSLSRDLGTIEKRSHDSLSDTSMFHNTLHRPKRPNAERKLQPSTRVGALTRRRGVPRHRDANVDTVSDADDMQYKLNELPIDFPLQWAAADYIKGREWWMEKEGASLPRHSNSKILYTRQNHRVKKKKKKGNLSALCRRRHGAGELLGLETLRVVHGLPRQVPPGPQQEHLSSATAGTILYFRGFWRVVEPDVLECVGRIARVHILELGKKDRSDESIREKLAPVARDRRHAPTRRLLQGPLCRAFKIPHSELGN